VSEEPEGVRLGFAAHTQMRSEGRHNAIDDAYFDKPPMVPPEPVILSSGLVRYLKGVDVLLEALRQVR
jgi:glycosyltransferase involved in cell wall biosynthesis